MHCEFERHSVDFTLIRIILKLEITFFNYRVFPKERSQIMILKIGPRGGICSLISFLNKLSESIFSEKDNYVA